jgi:serine palmitoyltransferase
MLLPNVYNVGYSAGQAIRSIIVNHTLPDPNEIGILLVNLPSLYKTWWLNLVTNDPIHVLIETTLIASILYMVIWRRKDWREDHKEGTLSTSEQEELLIEWRDRGRAGLVPINDSHNHKPAVVVHAMKGRSMDIASGDQGPIQTVLNFATHDFLGISGNSVIKEAAKEALDKYGCGSCGPRGFYGTIDVHLELEDSMAQFINTDGAILYSDGASAVSSTVAAFAKRGDLLVVDDGIYEPLMNGVSLSRANIKWFRHNDMVSNLALSACY